MIAVNSRVATVQTEDLVIARVWKLEGQEGRGWHVPEGPPLPLAPAEFSLSFSQIFFNKLNIC